MKTTHITGAVFSGLFLLTALAGPIQAHEKGNEKCSMKCCQEWSVDEKVEKLTKKLGLTAEQQTSIRAILEEKKTKMAGLKDQMKAAGEESQQKITGILTDDQKKKYEEMKKEMTGKHDKKK